MALNRLQETYKDRNCFSDQIDSEHHTKPQPEIIKLCSHVTFNTVYVSLCVCSCTPGSPKYSKINCIVFLIRQFIQQAKSKVREESEHLAINDLRVHY